MKQQSENATLLHNFRISESILPSSLVLALDNYPRHLLSILWSYCDEEKVYESLSLLYSHPILCNFGIVERKSSMDFSPRLNELSSVFFFFSWKTDSANSWGLEVITKLFTLQFHETIFDIAFRIEYYESSRWKFNIPQKWWKCFG
mgnify:CR=1 FL=1